MQGVSFAFALLGALAFFSYFYLVSLPLAIFAALIGSSFGLFFMLFLELVYTQIQKLHELKTQTKILQKIDIRLNEKLSDN
jgi:hypothetical protein